MNEDNKDYDELDEPARRSFSEGGASSNMEGEIQSAQVDDLKTALNRWKIIAIIFASLFIVSLLVEVDVNLSPRFWKAASVSKVAVEESAEILENAVFPEKGATLPVVWGDLGKKMVDRGVIDKDKFLSLYESRGGLKDSELALLDGSNNGNLTINRENSAYLLNLLWALGLSNKNAILEEGPMTDKKYGGAGNFASTGGWSLAVGGAMDHYSKYSFVKLTAKQQAMVEEVSKNIYRPCCGNSVYFPDCNHGMAMLGLLELMASRGANEQEMYKTALLVNSYWFPDTYLTIAKYFQKRGVDFSEVDPKEMLGSAYSSAQGYRSILAEVEPPAARSGGGGCGV